MKASGYRGPVANRSEEEAATGKDSMERRSSSSATSSTSSIGRNSDEGSAAAEGRGEIEVESAYKEPLNRMNALEEALPMRRGISKFYNGKSKSFATLADASASSIQEIAKAENAYTRKRRNLTAFHHVSGGISKRSIGSSRSTLAFAVAMNNSESSSSMSDDSNPSPPCRSPSRRPPLHPQQIRVSQCSPDSYPSQQSFSAWRSLSLFDFPHCANRAAAKFGDEGNRAFLT